MTVVATETPQASTELEDCDLEDHDLAIVGSGFAGLGMAVALREAGLTDFVLLERADDLGGTWRDNRYPGCGCDVPTPLYSFSFAPNPEWSHFYAKRGEIQDYLQDVATRYGVRPHLRMCRAVTGGRWDDATRRWTIDVNGIPAYTARVVVGATGGLSDPSWPEIAGLHDFSGRLLHTAQWPEDVDLAGKRVGVIGTGASAIQLVPAIADEAQRLTVFQRTAPWIMPKLDREIDERGKRLFRRHPGLQRTLRGVVFALTERLAFGLAVRPKAMKSLEKQARRHLEEQVEDPALRAKLAPPYQMGCKRILFSNDWYPAIARSDVDLVTERIDRVTRNGVRTADGVEHDVDVLVCSTGFDIPGLRTRLAMVGRGERSLEQAWAGGVEAHRGCTVAGFPNLFLLSGPNTGTGSTSQVYMIEAQIGYVMDALRAMAHRGAAAVEVRASAQAAYNRDLQERMSRTRWTHGGCNSWYLDEHGVNRVLYPGLASSFRRSVRRLAPGEYVFSDPLEPAAGRPAPSGAARPA